MHRHSHIDNTHVYHSHVYAAPLHATVFHWDLISALEAQVYTEAPDYGLPLFKKASSLK